MRVSPLNSRAILAALASLALLAPTAEPPDDPDEVRDALPTSSEVLPARDAEPVVLVGADLPAWSRLAAQGVPAPSPQTAFSSTRTAHNGTLVVPPDARAGVPVEQVTAYRWDGLGWREIPVQVDERFPNFLANANSSFNPYSGTDMELTYAWAPKGNTVGEEAWKKVMGECAARYPADAAEAQAAIAAGSLDLGPGQTIDSLLGPKPDPVPTLDDDDEIALMASDAGALAPSDAPGPAGTVAGTTNRQQVAITDPVTGDVGYVYLFLESDGPAFDHTNGYVRHERPATADWWADRNSWSDDDPEKLGTSNTGYGPNLKGTACVEADGTNYTLGAPRTSTDRFPLDGMTVSTDNYRATATGRWMFRDVEVSKPGQAGAYGPDLLDRWKGRAFQSSPDSELSVVGFEDEQVNWEANSALLGWRAGPVRTIREVWGADSGTNVTKTETYYRDQFQFRYRLRVHPIPTDGIYNAWDFNRDSSACYYTATLGVTRSDAPTCAGGVPVDGVNDEVVGNFDGAEYPADCDLASIENARPHLPDGCTAFFDAPDPTMDPPTAILRWEQVAGRGDNGSVVQIGTINTVQSAENFTALPYYRDDKCFDDGTGDDPVARPWPGEESTDPRVVAGYGDADGDGDIDCDDKQGAFASMGLHVLITGDTDNAHTGLPLTESDFTQYLFPVPTASPQPVGERYAQTVRAPLRATATAQPNTPGEPGTTLKAGVAAVDVTWKVGASAGQYAGEGPGSYSTHGDGVDPSVLSTTSRPTYGVESRTKARALVVEGENGRRWALVSNDLYIPQDLFNRRIAQILEEHDAANPAQATGITPENLTVTVSHSHSSPYYSSASWGVWTFEDVFDIRFFESLAQKMARAVIEASASMVPARVGAATTEWTIGKRNPEGPAVAYDGTPAGQPLSDTDPTLTVVRFDDVSGSEPRLLANWVSFGRHPEGMDGNDLHSGEYVNTAFRILEREIGGVTLFSQNDVGSGEVTSNARAHVPAARQEWDDNSHNQLERMGRQFADVVAATTADIDRVARGEAAVIADQVVTPRSDVPVGVHDLRFAPPSYRLFPTVSNCRTEQAVDGNPGVPIVGLPDCGFVVEDGPPFIGGGLGTTPGQELRENAGVDPQVTYDTLRAAGVPIPDNVGGPSYTGLQETLQVHLQAIRIGGIAITVCPCEQWTDQSRNIRTRLNAIDNDMYFGWDWTANYQEHPDFELGVIYDGQDGLIDENGYRHGPLSLPDANGEHWCVQNDDTTWTCKDPRNPTGPKLAPVSDTTFRTWKARIYNDARGWDAPENMLEAESEPSDPADIWGNWTHEELSDFAYELVVPISMGNDYWGYIPTYREFQSRDYYRKALAGLGPHSADFLNTRLTRMAAELNGAPGSLVERGAKDTAYDWDQEHQRARAALLGTTAQTAMPVYEAQLPADGGTPAVATQPTDITRFQVAEVTWVGGSNYTDIPHARVERCAEGAGSNCTRWEPFGDGYGEVQTVIDYPDPQDLPAYRAGQYQWKWTAAFEAYDSDIVHTDASGNPRTKTPKGTYRFVIDGCHRAAAPAAGANDPTEDCGAYDATGRVRPYQVVSNPFQVRPWKGITVEDLRISRDGRRVSFAVGPRFPYPISASNTALATYESAAGSLTRTANTYTNGVFDHAGRDVVDYPTTAPHPVAYVTGRDDASCARIDTADEIFERKENGRVVEAGDRKRCSDLKTYGAGAADNELFCFRCSFETWAETGVIERATVTVVRVSGRTSVVPATYNPVADRWVAAVTLRPGDRVFVDRGQVRDSFGERNGARSVEVVRRRPGRL